MMTSNMLRSSAALVLLAGIACSGGANGDPDPEDPSPAPEAGADGLANITSVTASGEPGQYSFAVTIQSPDTGCDRYADWWEVLSADGELLYRRILAHSHVDEQPFTRSGGPINATAADSLTIRAHLHTSNASDTGTYGGVEFVGSVTTGFAAASSVAVVSPSVEGADPQPTGCAF